MKTQECIQVVKDGKVIKSFPTNQQVAAKALAAQVQGTLQEGYTTNFDGKPVTQ